MSTQTDFSVAVQPYYDKLLTRNFLPNPIEIFTSQLCVEY